MYFEHTSQIWTEFPDLVPGVIFLPDIEQHPDSGKQQSSFIAIAKERLKEKPESQFTEIQAWRKTFSAMGLKPTQYRCASESLLRRLRKSGELPRIHPVIDLCNAVSVAFAIPVAVFDTDQIAGGIEVRHASGNETYEPFSGDIEHPTVGEIVFADEDNRLHARRWTNRQSRRSAVSDLTTSLLIVAEAMHETAASDIATLVDTLAGLFSEFSTSVTQTTLLSSEQPRFDFKSDPT